MEENWMPSWSRLFVVSAVMGNSRVLGLKSPWATFQGALPSGNERCRPSLKSPLYQEMIGRRTSRRLKVYVAPLKSAPAFDPTKMSSVLVEAEPLGSLIVIRSACYVVELPAGEHVVVSRGRVIFTLPIILDAPFAWLGPFFWRLSNMSSIKDAWMEIDSTTGPEIVVLIAVQLTVVDCSLIADQHGPF